MRPNLTGHAPNPNKPADRRGQVLFINADAEFHAGRAQNYLRPEHVEKIVSTFDRYKNIPGYARVVPLAEISSEANDFNLNIRRYVDNSPAPEPHDVRAHLLGGVPAAEVTDRNAPLSSNSSRWTCRPASTPPWPRSGRSWCASSKRYGTNIG
jgi:type I restriction enzyme M protein